MKHAAVAKGRPLLVIDDAGEGENLGEPFPVPRRAETVPMILREKGFRAA